jgi:uncharacterized protein DUF4238
MKGPPNNPPRSHHYVPIFYLKQWVGGDERLCQYRKVHNNKIAVKRKHPAGTGFKIDLYKLDQLPPVDAQAIETQFMQLVDGDAALALEHIKNDSEQQLSAGLRSAWSRFLLGFIFRNPEAVAEIKRHIVAMWEEGIEALEDEYAKNKRPEDPPSLAARVHPAKPQIGFANFLRGLIDNERLGSAIFDLTWRAVFLANSIHTLLTSDRPLHMPLGLGDANAYVALPIGPRVLFLASRDARLATRIASSNHNTIVKMLNRATVTQAREYVWGYSDAQRVFVQRNIATVPDRQLITDEQRLEGIAAARGESVDILRA